MKTRNTVTTLILTMLILLSSCAESPQTVPTTTVTFDADCLQKVMDTAEVISYTQDPLISYDPDREVYISMVNQDIDMYPKYWFNKGNALLITKEHYDISRIQINIPMQTKYTVEIMDWTDWATVPVKDSEQPTKAMQLYHYMCLQGVDWQELSKMKAYADAAHLLQRQSNKSEEMEIYGQICDQYKTAYNNIFASYQAQFNQLTDADIPQFAVYYIQIHFPDVGDYEETVETVEFVIDGCSYSVNIGQWRFHATLPQELLDGFNPIGVKQEDIVVGAIATSAYYDGYAHIPDTFTFKAEEDLTITGVHHIGVDLDLLGAKVQVSGQPEYFWEMETPIEVEKGDHVTIDIYAKDDRFAEHEVGIATNLILDYQIRSKSYGMVMPCLLMRMDTAVWNTYLMAFKGIDMGAFYTYWEKPQNDDWFEALPQAWLK